MVLRVSDLSVARGGLRILEAVSLELAPGTALLLRGPNGIGKTTLLRTIMGLQPALSGQIDAPADSLAYAGHLDGVKPTLSVTENLRFWASIFGGGDVEHALELFDLQSLRDRASGQLSAGQKRRLGLARLAVTGRTTWLLDEPTVSLDADARALFESAVTEHLKAGGAVLAATHLDLNLDAAQTLDMAQFKAKDTLADTFDEAFL
ncbi:MAG: heme ABC exporter ATP-binding protein CcmA [Pseudomonadota bacterium]